jgi:hypothetical protein
MLAWSVGTGLAVCWGLTAFALVTGIVMIQMEDAELEKRFGEDFRKYRRSTPSVFPRLHREKQRPRPRLWIDGAFLQCEVDGQPGWRIGLSELACVGEYTTAHGPWADDYFVVFATKNGLYYEAAVYSGVEKVLEALSAALGSALKLGLIQSTEFSSRVAWPPELEGRPLFVGGKKIGVNPEVRRLTEPRQL